VEIEAVLPEFLSRPSWESSNYTEIGMKVTVIYVDDFIILRLRLRSVHM